MYFLINGRSFEVEADVRTSLFDLLREHLHLSDTRGTANKVRVVHAPCLSAASE